eukprot:gnl/Hemi2/1262_TR453_c0_g1_i1.p1 gnl/Hemi2/1262_TR453_c0_g1~~gnl/Hemi2/1262_TR453_c0_g1_i1.p1  ORF type:complete len:474 (+),score=77.04 gnl/Hemi2/1262_TR453_c0_g1_i1:42-1463(+)
MAMRGVFGPLVWLGLAFFVLFSAFAAVQNTVSSVLPGWLGNYSMAVLFGTVVVSCFLVPAVLPVLGERVCMIVGSSTYVVYLLVLTCSTSTWLVLLCSVLIGLGSSLLWVGQGAALTKLCSATHRGKDVGIFWAIFACSNVVGNVLSSFLLAFFSNTIFFLAFTAVSALAVMMLCRFDYGDVVGLNDSQTTSSSIAWHPLPPSDGSDGAEDNSNRSATPHGTEEPEAAPGCWRPIGRALALLRVFPLPLLLLPFLYTGLALSFWTGTFPLLMDVKAHGLVLSTAGLANVLAGLSLGRLSDVIGRWATIVLGGAVYFCGVVCCAVLASHNQNDPLWSVSIAGIDCPLLAFAAAVAYGVGDSSFSTQSSALLGQLYANTPHVADAFTIFLFGQNVGGSIGFFVATVAPVRRSAGWGMDIFQVWLQGAALLLAVAGFVAADLLRLQRDAARTASSGLPYRELGGGELKCVAEHPEA